MAGAAAVAGARHRAPFSSLPGVSTQQTALTTRRVGREAETSTGPRQAALRGEAVCHLHRSLRPAVVSFVWKRKVPCAHKHLPPARTEPQASGGGRPTILP